MGTSVLYAFEYMLGIPFFGISYWVLNGLLIDLRVMSVTDTVYQYANLIWAGAVVVYMIFGIFYFIRQVKTWTIMR